MTKGTPTQSPQRWFDLLAVLLLLGALLVAASQLIATDWSDDLLIMWPLVTLGCILGLAIGYSRFSPGVGALLVLLYGLFIIPWFLGLLQSAELPWLERLEGMLRVLGTTFRQLGAGQDVTSSLLYVVLFAILAWLISTYAGYTLLRYARPWKAVLPAGLATLLIATVSVRETMHTGLLMAYIFLALLLVARVNFLKNHGLLRGEPLILPTEVGYNLAVATILAVMLLFVLAWFSPALGAALPSFKEPWQTITQPLDGLREGARKAFAPLDSSIALIEANVVRDYYGDVLALGRGNVLSESVIINVEAPEPPDDVSRYYWRARHFDRYEDGAWESTQDGIRSLAPGQLDLTFPELAARWETEVRVTADRRLSTLFTPVEPGWIDLPVEAELAINPDGTADVAAIRARPSLENNETYTVRGSLPRPTIAQLREAGREYPAWITDRYLQLPDSITQRTLDLAEQIASGLDNPYDIAAAVTEYLRENIQYQDYLPERPSGQDPVDWMLFDLQQGFCNYYSSAEVILLRSLGIPARITVGYAQGQVLSNPLYDAQATEFFPDLSTDDRSATTRTYRVRQADAHAWPEVYFPGIGWVEFEPTVNQIPIRRPAGVESTVSSAAAPQGGESPLEPGLIDEPPMMEEELDPFRQSEGAPATASAPEPFPWQIFLTEMVVLVLIVLGSFIPWSDLPPLPVLLISAFRRLGQEPPESLLWWERYLSLSPVDRSYLELNRALVLVRRRPDPAATPTERAAQLAIEIPPARDPAEVVVDEYQASTYGSRPGNPKNALRAGRILRRLSIRSMLSRIIPGLSPEWAAEE